MPTNGVLEKNFPSVYTGFVPAFEEALQTKGGKKKGVTIRGSKGKRRRPNEHSPALHRESLTPQEIKQHRISEAEKNVTTLKPEEKA